MIDNYILDKDYLFYLKERMQKKDYLKLYKNLYNIIESDEYKILLSEYDEFITNVYKLFLELNITSSLEVALLYNKLLFEGLFSYDGSFYLKNSTKYDFLVKTWGSTVCTSNSVCRHNVMFLVDLERKLGNNVECVDLTCINTKNLYRNMLIKYFDKLYVNHLAIGLKDKDKLYVYDPTNYVFLLKNNVNHNYIDFISYDEDINKINMVINYFDIRNNTNNFDYKKAISIFDINKEYVNNIKSCLDELFQINSYLLNEFHLDNSKQIRKIKYLNNDIIQKQNKFK